MFSLSRHLYILGSEQQIDRRHSKHNEAMQAVLTDRERTRQHSTVNLQLGACAFAHWRPGENNAL